MSEILHDLEWGMACRPTKRQDRVLARWLDRRDALLVGIADGVSSGDGEAAATWLEKTIHRIADTADETLSAVTLFAQIKQNLVGAPLAATMIGAQSTLSCGICEVAPSDAPYAFRFDFFAVGDSPVWRVAKISNGGELGFQANVVYAGALPGETGRLYSFVSVNTCEIVGNVHFGSVCLAEGELLVVASDGMPEWQIFADDQDARYGADSPRLIERAFDIDRLTDDFVKQVIVEYDKKRLLIDDDVSIVMIRTSKNRLANRDIHSKSSTSPTKNSVLKKWSVSRLTDSSKISRKNTRRNRREFLRKKHRTNPDWRRR